MPGTARSTRRRRGSGSSIPPAAALSATDRRVRRRNPDGRRRATNGAFYAHFDSKDDLVATVVGDHLVDRRRSSASCRPAAPDSRSSCASTCRLLTETTLTSAALGSPSRRGRAVRPGDQEGVHRRRQGDPGRDLHAPVPGGSGVGAPNCALAVHDARRVDAAGPGAVRQEAVERRPRGGHPERVALLDTGNTYRAAGTAARVTRGTPPSTQAWSYAACPPHEARPFAPIPQVAG